MEVGEGEGDTLATCGGVAGGVQACGGGVATFLSKVGLTSVVVDTAFDLPEATKSESSAVKSALRCKYDEAGGSWSIESNAFTSALKFRYTSIRFMQLPYIGLYFSLNGDFQTRKEVGILVGVGQSLSNGRVCLAQVRAPIRVRDVSLTE